MSYALDMRAPAEIEATTAAVAPLEAAAPWSDGAHRSPMQVRSIPSRSRTKTRNCSTASPPATRRRFARSVERHVDRAYAIALRIVGNAADAEDVVQDTMLKVWTHRGRWQHGRAKFSTWLYRVVSNRCIDLRRKPRTENVDVVPEVADTQLDASTVIERNEVGNLLEVGDAAAARAAAGRGDPVLSREHEQRRNRRCDGHDGRCGGVAAQARAATAARNAASGTSATCVGAFTDC